MVSDKTDLTADSNRETKYPDIMGSIVASVCALGCAGVGVGVCLSSDPSRDN